MKFQPVTPAKSPSSTGNLGPGDKRRIALLIGGLVVTGGALVSTLYQARKPGSALAPKAVVDESAASEPRLAVPELDVARLESLVHESEPADQVVFDGAAAEMLMGAARRYTPRHYAELEAPELDAPTRARLLAEPASARGRPFTARGRVVSLRPRTGATLEDQYLGRIELEDGGTVHFLVLAVPEHTAEIGGFVRVDGLFLKNYSVEDELTPGTWTVGPLLIGARAERSYPALGTVRQLDLSLFDDLEDANLAPDPGTEARLLSETPAEPLWALLAYARDLPDGAIDWNQAPTLDQRLLDQLLEQPAESRALPVRIPISRLQDGRVCVAGENPARMTRTMQGWIGNTTWKGVIRFHTPDLHPEFVIGDLVFGQGFFLHDFSYQSSERGLRVAPVFVLQSIQRHIPQPSLVLTRIPWLLAGIGIVLVVLLIVLTRRDGKRSSEFYGEMTRRRRERRARIKNGSGKGNVGSAAP